MSPQASTARGASHTRLSPKISRALQLVFYTAALVVYPTDALGHVSEIPDAGSSWAIAKFVCYHVVVLAHIIHDIRSYVRIWCQTSFTALRVVSACRWS